MKALILPVLLVLLSGSLGPKAQEKTADLAAEIQTHVAQLYNPSASDWNRQVSLSSLPPLLEQLQSLVREPQYTPNERDYWAVVDGHFILGYQALNVPEKREVANQHLREAMVAATTGKFAERIAQIGFHLSFSLLEKAQLREAEATLEKVFKRVNRESAPIFWGWCASNQALALRRKGKTHDSVGWLKEALETLNVSDYPDHHLLLEPTIYHELVNAYLELGQPDIAGPWLAREKQAAQRSGDFVAIRKAELSDIWTDIVAWRHRAAERKASQALKDPQVSNYAPLRVRFELNKSIACCHLRFENPDFRGKSITLFNELLSSNALEGTEMRQAQFFLCLMYIESDQLDVAQSILDTIRKSPTEGEESLVQQTYHQALQLWIDLENGSTESELAEQHAELRDSYADFLVEWRQAPLTPGGIGFLEFDTRRFVPATLIRFANQMLEPERAAEVAFDILMQAQAVGTLARKLSLEAPSLAEARSKLLGKDHGLLVYLSSTFESYVIAVDQEEAFVSKLESLPQLEPLRKNWIKSILIRPRMQGGAVSASASARVETAGKALGSKLFPKRVRDKLAQWKQVSISGIGLFGLVMPESLPVEGIGQLGLVKAISTLPSIPVACHLAKRPRLDHSLQLKALVAPDFGADDKKRWEHLNRIPLTKSKLDRIVAPFRNSAELHYGASATLDSMTVDSSEKTAAELFVLTHGVQLAGQERPSALALAPDKGKSSGILDSFQVEALYSEGTTAPPLVFLAACGSTRAPSRRGEDSINHLGGAFFFRGSQVVIASPADLDLDSAVYLAECFHQELASGNSPAESLRVARQKLSRDKRFAHPYFYGLIQCLGLGHR